MNINAITRHKFALQLINLLLFFSPNLIPCFAKPVLLTTSVLAKMPLDPLALDMRSEDRDRLCASAIHSAGRGGLAV